AAAGSGVFGRVLPVRHERPESVCSFYFFFQAEDGIRDFHVTGVQTCALPSRRSGALRTTWAMCQFKNSRRFRWTSFMVGHSTKAARVGVLYPPPRSISSIGCFTRP